MGVPAVFQQIRRLCSIISVIVAFLFKVEAFEWIVDSNTSYAFAIQQISFGDTITLKEGVYSGAESCDKTIAVSNVTIKAATSRRVVIDCNRTRRHIKITGEHVQIHGISFTNGYSMVAGGCIVINGINTVIESCIFEGCISSGFGGGLILDFAAAKATIKNVIFLKCSAVRGGAIFVDISARLTLTGDFLFRENTATMNGGALYLDVWSSAIIINALGEMNGNTARMSGGAVHIGRGDLTISGAVSFVNNTVTFQTLSSAGGAFFGVASSLTITSRGSVIFRENSCVYVGGALALYSDSNVRIDGDVQFRGDS
jgi:predicted outer membrane repeat protein